MTHSATRAVGTSTTRVDGPQKVAGTAPYSYEHPVPDPAYLVPLVSTIARGTVDRIDTAAAEAVPGVITVLTPWNAPRLTDEAEGEYVVLQNPDVLFRGQLIGAVVAESPEAARYACELLSVEYTSTDHDARFRPDHPDAYKPETANGGYPPDSERGDADGAIAAADVVIDEWYSTPEEHNNPLEPHTVVALWDGETLTLYTSRAPAFERVLTDPVSGQHLPSASTPRPCGWSARTSGAASDRRADPTRTTCSVRSPPRRCPAAR